MSKIDEKFKIDISSLYQKQDLLAKNYLGVYGFVYKALNKKTQQSALLKQIDLTGVPQTGRSEIYKEVTFLSQLQHESFLTFLGYQELKDQLVYVLEFPDELLSDYVAENKEITKLFLLNIITTVLLGLQFLEKKIGHSLGKIEVNLDNIVICNNGNIKLCDILQTLKIIKNIRIEQGFTSDDNKGLFPPEEFSLNSIVQQENKTEFKSIIFSLGMILCKLIDNEAFMLFVEGRLTNDSNENLNQLLVKIKSKIDIDLFEILMLMVNYEPILRHDSDGLLALINKKKNSGQNIDLGLGEDNNVWKELVKKKDKDIFIMKDQLRVANEQNLKLTQENEKHRMKIGPKTIDREISSFILFYFISGGCHILGLKN